MEDNARPHATTLTKTYLENRYIQKIECSPAKDLNQIENVLLKMKREISRQKKVFKSADEVMATI